MIGFTALLGTFTVTYTRVRIDESRSTMFDQGLTPLASGDVRPIPGHAGEHRRSWFGDVPNHWRADERSGAGAPRVGAGRERVEPEECPAVRRGILLFWRSVGGHLPVRDQRVW